MPGPYSWMPPNYWYTTSLGGAFGFITEAGMEALFSMESFKMTIPDDYSWPINDMWMYHFANPASEFNTLAYITPGLNARLGESDNQYAYLEK